MEITKHFTTTVTIVCGDKVLLHLHKKLKKWIPVGGHIDRDEIPHESALREVREEAGLKVELYNPDKTEVDLGDSKRLIRPMHLDLQNINAFHQHIDFAYYGKSETFDLNPGDGESGELKWFTMEEIMNGDFQEDVQARAIEALEILSN